MRCPVCDYDPELSLDQQSAFFSGISFDVKPMPWVGPDGSYECNCFAGYDEDDVGYLDEEDMDDGC